ncbi:hypothetical protein MMC25_002583 [Agyrium rufum]|nr:hypothetical protein [Agyrium rufum]
MSVTNQNDLSTIITPSLLDSIFATKTPYEPHKPFDNDLAIRYTYNGIPNEKENLKIGYPVLKALSELGFSEARNLDLLAFLPTPEDHSFPARAFALIYILDQLPRKWFEGKDERYTNVFFDILAIKLSHQLHALPEHLRPDSQRRWVEEMGYPVEVWAMTRFWFMAPFAHSENVEDQAPQSAMCEEVRVVLERRSEPQGVLVDPYRKTREALDGNVYAFANAVMKGPPPMKEGMRIEEHVFWFLMLFGAHPAIIKRFGRYPYRNRAVGRETTSEEEEYLEKTQHLFETDAETARLIKEDVVAGDWSPLGSDPRETKVE